jgi:hypothetical protein
MHLSAEQLAIASRIDAKVQRLMAEGADDIAIFVEMADDMPAIQAVAGLEDTLPWTGYACGLAGSIATQRSLR